MTQIKSPFIGSEALTRGGLSRHQLRTGYRRVFPDVYTSAIAPMSLRDRITAAWLWSGRKATIAGLAAAALHGAKWVDDDVVIELICSNAKTPPGISTRRVKLLRGEQQVLGGALVTSPARTAFDVGRRGRVDDAVARLDALARATKLTLPDVTAVAQRHPGARGLRHLDTVLELADAGAESPRETWLRLLFIRAGLPRPRTQIPVTGSDGLPFAYLDMGWDDCMVAVEYDGEHHQTSRSLYTNDIRRTERVEQCGWQVIRVVKEDYPADILRRVRLARQFRSASVR